jgi:hypothetical protein
MTVVENDTPALTQARALEGIVSSMRRERDDANADRARLLRVNIALTGELAEVTRERDGLRAEIARHRAAAVARAAVEAAADARPARRPLSPREQALATLASLAVLAVLCGLAASSVALLLGGLAVLGVSGAALAVCRTAPDPGRPFDLDPDAPKRTVHRG